MQLPDAQDEKHPASN